MDRYVVKATIEVEFSTSARWQVLWKEQKIASLQLFQSLNSYHLVNSKK